MGRWIIIFAWKHMRVETPGEKKHFSQTKQQEMEMSASTYSAADSSVFLAVARSDLLHVHVWIPPDRRATVSWRSSSEVRWRNVGKTSTDWNTHSLNECWRLNQSHALHSIPDKRTFLQIYNSFILQRSLQRCEIAALRGKHAFLTQPLPWFYCHTFLPIFLRSVCVIVFWNTTSGYCGTTILRCLSSIAINWRWKEGEAERDKALSLRYSLTFTSALTVQFKISCCPIKEGRLCFLSNVQKKMAKPAQVLPISYKRQCQPTFWHSHTQTS